VPKRAELGTKAGADHDEDVELDFLGGPKKKQGESTAAFLKRRADFRKQQLKGVFKGSGGSSSSSKDIRADSGKKGSSSHFSLLSQKSSEPGSVAASASSSGELSSAGSVAKSSSSFTKAPSITPKPRLEMCLCCQKKHFVTSEHPNKTIQPVESYLHGAGVYHMIQRESDGLWICEWCAHYPCTRCSKLKEELLQPVPGLWAKGHYECVPRCETKGKGGFEGIREAVHARAEGFERVHCHACRDLLMAGKVPGAPGLNPGVVSPQQLGVKPGPGGAGGGSKRRMAVQPAIQLVVGVVGVTLTTVLKAAPA
jgi:hypothetical protein